MSEKSYHEQIVELYRNYLQEGHSDYLSAWPILTGYNPWYGTYKGWTILILKHTGVNSFLAVTNLGEITKGIMKENEITKDNIPKIRDNLIKYYGLLRQDAIFFLDNKENNIKDDLWYNHVQHDMYMGLSPMKLFLSHKGSDKKLVRDFKLTLSELGFEPWLDEDAMPAGTNLERGILSGFKESCAAIFFITPDFKDEKYLASEVDYAIQEKRSRGDNFAIVTIVFQESDKQAQIPDLLKPYVWKEPKTHLEALREILKAVPLKLGDTRVK